MTHTRMCQEYPVSLVKLSYFFIQVKIIQVLVFDNWHPLNVGPDYRVILFSSDLYCINEYHLFLVLYGIYSGVMYVFYHYYKQVNYLQFPPLQVSVGLKM